MYGLIFAVLFAAITYGVLRSTSGIIAAVINGLLGLFVGYFCMPTLAYGFYGVSFAAVIASIVILIFAIAGENKFGTLGGSGLVGISVVYLLFVPLFTSWAFWGENAAQYRSLIGEVQESKFSEDIAPIDPTAVRLVDQAQAKKLAESRLGEDTALGSRVKVGTFNIQSVNGKLYWVAPLIWNDVFKWAFGEKGSPGYMKVSATNQRDIQLVQTVDNKPLSLQILYDSGFFGDYLPRVLYTNGYASTGFEDYTFEIDDAGRPYWVVTKIEKKVGFHGTVATGVIIVDPQTRDVKEYTIAEAPSWIDRIQPEDLVNTRINDWGDFVHGWWNPSGLDRTKATKGLSLVYGKDDVSYWYTGIQTVGADEGTLGFMLVNTRTGKTKFYKQPGITEEAAQNNIRGLVAEKPGWSVTNSILYNVGGAPTYISVIKDADGNPKEVGIASALYRNVVVSHANIRGALRAYTAAMRSSGGTAVIDKSLLKQIDVKGKVIRFNREVLDGNTLYYMMVDSNPDKILTAAPGLSSELVVTKIGDSVHITVGDLGLPNVDMITFDNLEIELSGKK